VNATARLTSGLWEADRHSHALGAALVAEPFEDWPMRDRLDRLEELGWRAALRHAGFATANGPSFAA